MSWRSVLGDGLFSLPHSLGRFLSLFTLNILSTSNPNFSSDIQNWASNSDTFRWICNTHLRPNMSQTQHQIIAIKPPPFTKSIVLGNGKVTVQLLMLNLGVSFELPLLQPMPDTSAVSKHQLFSSFTRLPS